MTARKTEVAGKGVLDGEIKRLMTPRAMKDLAALNPTVQQFLLRLLDVREEVLAEALCKKITDAICKQMVMMLNPVWIILEDLSKGQKSIMKTLEELRKRLDKIEKRVYVIDDRKFKKLEQRLRVVEKTIKIHTIKKTA